MTLTKFYLFTRAAEHISESLDICSQILSSSTSKYKADMKKRVHKYRPDLEPLFDLIFKLYEQKSI